MIKFFSFLFICFFFIIKYAGSEGTKKKYFFAVEAIIRDEAHVIREFIRHYIEEGVDHVFLYDDYSKDGTIDELKCIDSSYYTIIPVFNAPGKKHHGHYQAVYERIKRSTEWLAVIDADEFIASRIYPHRTVRDILSDYSHCALLNIPWVLYSWNTLQTTQKNHIRDSMVYRWGYDAKYNHNISDMTFKFRDRHQFVENKVIVKTSQTKGVKTHEGFLLHRNTVCIPFIGEGLSCSFKNIHSMINDSNDSNSSSSSDIEGVSLKRKVRKYPPHGCRKRLSWTATKSDIFTQLSEEDIPKLALAVHHYRVKSEEDWMRKSNGSRMYSERYRKKNAANRCDVYDDFLSTKRRREIRKNHPQQLIADKAMAQCDHPEKVNINTSILFKNDINDVTNDVLNNSLNDINTAVTVTLIHHENNNSNNCYERKALDASRILGLGQGGTNLKDLRILLCSNGITTAYSTTACCYDQSSSRSIDSSQKSIIDTGHTQLMRLYNKALLCIRHQGIESYHCEAKVWMKEMKKALRHVLQYDSFIALIGSPYNGLAPLIMQLIPHHWKIHVILTMRDVRNLSIQKQSPGLYCIAAERFLDQELFQLSSSTYQLKDNALLNDTTLFINPLADYSSCIRHTEYLLHGIINNEDGMNTNGQRRAIQLHEVFIDYTQIDTRRLARALEHYQRHYIPSLISSWNNQQYVNLLRVDYEKRIVNRMRKASLTHVNTAIMTELSDKC